jgi:N6-adenosine-specific RNA methylase IME4
MCSDVSSTSRNPFQLLEAAVVAAVQRSVPAASTPCVVSTTAVADCSITQRLPEDHTFAGLLRNGYRCLLIDPPTRFVAGTKGRPQHYERMTDIDIASLPVADLLHPEGAWIFLWVTSPKLYAPPRSKSQRAPDDVVRAWGARYSGRAFVWVKTKAKATKSIINCENDLHVGMGFTTRKNAEDCLLFRTGMPQRLARDVREVIVSPVRQHSRKPDEAIARIERFCPGPRVELFAREIREGWHAWGDEIGKFNERARAQSNSPVLPSSSIILPAKGEYHG